MQAWEAIEKLLSEGHSWSGNERNCCFLNTGSQRFADVSAVTGLDLKFDSRGIGTVDWDLDGDLDLWISNRTAPRLSFLRNDFHPASRFLAVRLIGSTANRDAIGARVELVTRQAGAPRAIRTLRAGEGYLSQSSKWIHFGLEGSGEVDRVLVRWPGGASEEFRGLGAGRRYELVQGSGSPREWVPPARQVHLAASAPGRAPAPAYSRVVPHSRLPLPRLEHLDFDGNAVAIEGPRRGPLLVTLWATWCAPCRKELHDLRQSWDRLRALGLEVLPLSVDDLDAAAPARRARVEPILTEWRTPWRGGLATTGLVERLNAVQRALLSSKQPLPIPSAFLIDAGGSLAAIYKGVVPVERLLEDVRACGAAADAAAARDAAVPLPGRWYINPFGVDLLAVPRELAAVSQHPAALEYLARHTALDTAGLETARARSAALSAETLVDTYLDVGLALARDKRWKDATTALSAAASLSPGLWAAQAALAEALREQGDRTAALAQYRRMLALRPGDPAAANNVAWMLATHPSATAADGEEAVEHALDLCQRTRFRLPSALDTLAAAYAAAGRFDQAVTTAQKAIELAASGSQTDLAEKVRRRLELYAARRAYREEPGGPVPR